MKIGIVGLPNVGKSTLFNALTKAGAESANYPFCTIDANVGVVDVPDERIENLGKLFNTKRVVPTTIEFVDIAGLVKGASQGEGLGNQFLANIREVDAICHVVRVFQDDNITHVSGQINPIEDIEIIDLELILADLEIVQKRLAKANKSAKYDKTKQYEVEALKKLEKILTEGKKPNQKEFSEKEWEFLQTLQLIVTKPVLYVLNTSESPDESEEELIKKVRDFLKDQKVLTISAEIEQEIIELTEEERELFLEELGLEESGLNRVIKNAYDLLGLMSFLTAGADECRAWTIKKGTKAPEAAGKVHSDMQRGFIRAEVTNYHDLLKYGSESKTKELGLTRIEGKDYVMQDDDVVLFRFNV